jgi:hypothetical protein
MKHEIDYGRSIGAVVGGFFVRTGLGAIGTVIAAKLLIAPAAAGQMPTITTSYLMLMLVVNIVTSVIGGYVTAMIAGVYRLHHAAVLGGIIFAVSVIFLLLPSQVFPGSEIFPAWYPQTSAVISPLCIIAGGWLRHRKAA